MKKLLLACLCLLCHTFYAQWQWAKKFTSNGHYYGIESALNSQGNFFILGKGGLWQGAQDIYQLDTNANLISQYKFPANLTVTDIKINSLDQVMVTGSMTGTLTLGSTQFISTGASDIFIGAFNSNFQLIWGKVIGGKSGDAGRAIVIDSHDRIFVYGSISDTVNFQGSVLKCNSNGNKFVAAFNKLGQLNWVLKDSTDNTLAIDEMNMFINKNNELIFTGAFDQKSFYHFNGYSLTIPPLNSYDYGYHFAIKIDSTKNVTWGDCIKKPKWGHYYYEGLTSRNAFIFYNITYAGDIDCQLILVDNSGARYKTIFPKKQIDNSVTPLGSINDEPYFLHIGHYYDQYGPQRVNYLFTLQNDNPVYFKDTISGQIYDCTLLKNKKNEYFLCGTFSDTINAGSHTLMNSNVTPFVAKLGSGGVPTGIRSEDGVKNKIQIFPNPSGGSFMVAGNSLKPGNYEIIIRNISGAVIYSEKVNVTETSFHVELPGAMNGLYFIEISGDSQRINEKILINK
jgi:hypothetical protein